MDRMLMFLLMAHLFVFLSFNSIATLATESVNKSEIDRQALLSIRAGITSDPLSVLGSWQKNSLNFCSWRGVACGKALPLRVVSLALGSLQLTGTLSPFVANLTSLARLDLGNNQFSGDIPEQLGTLKQLQSLMLASNKLKGNIPASLGSISRSLNYVNLADNALTGGIPHSLASCSSLAVLNLTRNNIYGMIPPSIFNDSFRLVVCDLGMNVLSGPIPDFHDMANLQILKLSNNLLSGSIPPSLGNVSTLNKIFLDTNNLTGPIPETLGQIRNLSLLDLSDNQVEYVPTEIYNLSSLRILELSRNNIVGPIPFSIGNSLRNLEGLSMGSNRINGSIPVSLANSSKIKYIDLSDNLLVGPVPSLGSLPYLSLLYFGSNYLESDDWTFLISLKNCTQLEVIAMDGNALNGSLPRLIGKLAKSLAYIDFQNNKIVGPIPVEIGKLTSLIMLNLGQNQLVGKIPVAIQNLSNLQMFDIRQNMLSRRIPSTFANLGNLIILNLSNNRLSGQIPSTLGNLSQLSELNLDNNNLSGKIPESFGNCTQLVRLNLSSNSFCGAVPSQLFNNITMYVSLDLSHNAFTGSIPPLIGLSMHLIFLDISFNNLSGQVPSTLGQCVTLSSLNMKRNMITGTIPESFSNLESISQMDLSENNFVGEIPQFFQNFTLWSHLDLSDNYFEGPIPTGGIFHNISAVSLHGNIGLCASEEATTFLFGFAACPVTSIPESKKNGHLVLIVIPPIIIALISFLCFVVTLRNNRAQTTPCYKDTMKKVSYGDILRATNWLSPVNKISSSHTGSIYIGRFEFDTDPIAIKVFHLNEYGSLKSFLMECEVLRNTRHRNLMKAVTLCSTVDFENNEFKAIVFDFMANGSLDMWVHPKLHQETPKRGLTFGQLLRIAMDVASALDYMHNQLTPPLIHCDLKPANVLLDYDMTARVGDFGSAKFLTSTRVADKEGFVGMGGTIGYIAPEYGMGQQISTGCDVYSFGVLLLEMLTGKGPTDAMFTDGVTLHKLVRSAYPNGLCEVLDPCMSQFGHHAFGTLVMQIYVVPIVEVALLCSMESPKDRPAMQDVHARIFAINKTFPESW